MKQGLQKVLLCFGAGILVQGGAYFYLDQVLFAPASDYNVSDINKSDQTAKADKEAFAGVKLQGNLIIPMIIDIWQMYRIHL